MEVCNTVQEAVTKTIPKKKKCKMAKWQNGYLRRPYKYLRKEEKQKGRENERYIHLNAEFQRGERKTSQVNYAKKIEETIEWERLEISSRHLEITREHFMQR